MAFFCLIEWGEGKGRKLSYNPYNTYNTYNSYQCKYKKKSLFFKKLFVGLPGFEPGMTGPESVVLPLHHSPIWSLSFLTLQK